MAQKIEANPDLDDFFGDGIGLTTFDSDNQKKEQQQTLDDVFQITDLNAFNKVARNDDFIAEGSVASGATQLTTDAFEDESIGLRDFSEAQILIPDKSKSQQPQQPQPINLTRKQNDSFLEGDTGLIQLPSWLKCLQCIKIEDYRKYFDLTTNQVIQRLKYSAIGHLTGMPKPPLEAMPISQDPEAMMRQAERPDFDLYGPCWLMITLVVEVSIIGNINRSISAMYDEDPLANHNFSMSTVSNLFTFILFFFSAAPAGIYLFARVKLLDSSTKFLRYFAFFAYSFVSYVPAVLLTLVQLNFLKWLFILLAVTNQLMCLKGQLEVFVEHTSQENQEKLTEITKYALAGSSALFALLLKAWFLY